MSVSNQFITSEVGKLAKLGIVEKSPDEADRRSMFLNLTPRGQSLLRELGPLRRESNDLMYRSLTGDRARILQEIMDALIADGEIALPNSMRRTDAAKKAQPRSSKPGLRLAWSANTRRLNCANRGKAKIL